MVLEAGEEPCSISAALLLVLAMTRKLTWRNSIRSGRNCYNCVAVELNCELCEANETLSEYYVALERAQNTALKSVLSD